MAALSLSIDAIRPLNRWDHSSIRPGPVGSVGVVNMTPRLKSSLPGDFRWEATYFGNKESNYGSNITDGFHTNYSNGGGPAHTIDSNWGGRRRFETSHGWRYQDMRVPDRRIEPVLGTLPQYSWHNRIATVNSAKHTGDLFTVPRGGVLGGPAGVTRGGQFPRVTDVVGGEVPAMTQGASATEHTSRYNSQTINSSTRRHEHQQMRTRNANNGRPSPSRRQ